MLELAIALMCAAVVAFFVPRVVSGTAELLDASRREKMKRHLDWVNPEPQRGRKRPKAFRR